jgi:hypothetical protein
MNFPYAPFSIGASSLKQTKMLAARKTRFTRITFPRPATPARSKRSLACFEGEDGRNKGEFNSLDEGPG